MSVMIIGGGALGMLFAGKLAAADHKIILVTRTDRQAQNIRENGLYIDGKQTFPQALSFESTEVDNVEAPQWIVFMVKQFHLQSDALLDWVDNVKAPGTKVICFQNGIGHIERCRSKLNEVPVYAAVTTEGAKKQSDYEVLHTGMGYTVMGMTYGPASAAEAAENKCMNIFQSAGFNIFLSNEINTWIWNKLLINAVINPLTALMRIPNGMLIELPDVLPLMKQLLDEGVEVAESLGVTVAEDMWERILDVCKNTAKNTSSMLSDVLNGRTTEIDWINGKMISIAKQQGIQTPAHRMIYSLVKGLESYDIELHK